MEETEMELSNGMVEKIKLFVEKPKVKNPKMMEINLYFLSFKEGWNCTFLFINTIRCVLTKIKDKLMKF